jgi:hypothetical protein
MFAYLARPLRYTQNFIPEVSIDSAITYMLRYIFLHASESP